MISPSAPLDPYGFIESEDEIEQNQNYQTTDKTNDKLSNISGNNPSTSFCGTINSDTGNPMFYDNNMEPNTRKQTIDSGISSDCSTQSYNISPSRYFKILFYL